MSKNTNSRDYAKVDVDQYLDNIYVDDELVEEIAEGPDEGEVHSLMNQYPFYLASLPGFLLSAVKLYCRWYNFAVNIIIPAEFILIYVVFLIVCYFLCFLYCIDGGGYS